MAQLVGRSLSKSRLEFNPQYRNTQTDKQMSFPSKKQKYILNPGKIHFEAAARY
jgi:hypothetical protein